MFTGLVQTVGTMSSLDGSRLRIEVDERAWPDPIEIGESVAVNGCCLTVAARAGALEFDLSEETLSRTALGLLIPGQPVNLERALRAGDRLGGHFVQGHVDGIGRLTVRADQKEGALLTFAVPESGAKFLIDKGSIAIDGVSLTVIEPHGGEFTVAAIPHTLRNTNLGELPAGSEVNVEFDVLAKHVAHLLDR